MQTSSKLRGLDKDRDLWECKIERNSSNDSISEYSFLTQEQFLFFHTLIGLVIARYRDVSASDLT